MFNLFKKKLRRAFTAKDILSVIDKSARDFQFPMLDNGNVYLATSRLSLYGSAEGWAIVIELFGFSPRAGCPDLSVTTISNKLHNRNQLSDYVSPEAYQAYLSNNPSTEMRNFWPISDNFWIDEDEPEHVIPDATFDLRGHSIAIPDRKDLEATGIELEGKRVAIFELCRFLAAEHRADVLGTEKERRVSVDPEMHRILELDDWHHPDLAAGQLPSQTKTFQKLASVLESKNAASFEVSEIPNNHWKNWPDGGRL